MTKGLGAPWTRPPRQEWWHSSQEYSWSAATRISRAPQYALHSPYSTGPNSLTLGSLHSPTPAVLQTKCLSRFPPPVRLLWSPLWRNHTWSLPTIILHLQPFIKHGTTPFPNIDPRTMVDLLFSSFRIVEKSETSGQYGAQAFISFFLNKIIVSSESKSFLAFFLMTIWFNKQNITLLKILPNRSRFLVHGCLMRNTHQKFTHLH